MNDMNASLCLKRHLLILTVCVFCSAMSGCVESIGDLASDSRLPKWIILPSGLTRGDVIVQEAIMEPTRRGVDIRVTLYDKKWRKLEVVRGKTFSLSGRYVVEVVDGEAEVIGLKMQKNEHGIDFPYFFVVDDPALKRKLLDQNKWKLLQDDGMDYPALRKKLLDQNYSAISDNSSR
jgi:hypothetical protein